MRNKSKYIIYTDGATKGRDSKEPISKNDMGIGWVQTNEIQEWPEEEVAFGLEGWQISTVAELIAIWVAILMISKEKQIEIYTDSNAVIRNISRSLEQTDRNKIIKKKNAIWIIKIKDLVKMENIQIDLVKVKSHSKDK